MNDPLLWFANRGTGVVLLAVLTASVCLGVLSTARAGSRLWPRFLTQGLHRNLALLALALTAVHASTAVLDEYVDIRWWQALWPFGSTYKPLWLSLGTIAFDLLLAAALTSLFRHRLDLRVWRAVHLSTYAAFGLAVVHGIGIGTDARERWSVAVTLACVGCVLVASFARVAIAARVEVSR